MWFKGFSFLNCYTSLLRSGYHSGMKSDMKDQTHVVRRRGIYYYRRRIPEHLISHYGKSEVIFSLSTRDPKEAARLGRLEDVRRDQEWAHITALRSATPAEGLTGEEITRIATLYHAHILAEDEEQRLEDAAHGGISDRKWDNRAYGLEIVSDAESLNAGRSRLGDTFEEEDFVASLGIKLSSPSPSFVPLMVAMKTEYRKALEALKVRHAGGVVETPVVEPLVLRSLVQADERDSLQGIYDYWNSQKQRSRRSLDEAFRAITTLGEIAPGVPASGIQKAHIVTLKDMRLASGKNPKTVRKELGLLRAIFRMVIKNAWLPSLTADPTANVYLPVPSGDEEEDRAPFSAEDLRALFTSEIYTRGARPIGGSGEASFWLPLLSLWTGARLDELGQLDAVDVREEQGGWFFDIIHAPAKERRTKGKKSRRAPLHPELIRCGFLEYVKGIREAGHVKLFPGLSSGKGRQVTASFSQWFGRHLRRVVKIADPDKVFHSFRHTFRDAWRECLLPEDVGDAIVGHKNPSIGRRYGGPLYPLRPMYEFIGRLRFEGLDLSHLHKK